MRFGILRPLQAVGDDGRELALGGRMPRAVLAVLLLRANEVVSSDQLVEALWAGAAPASGAKGLHVHVSRLRRALAAGDSDQDGERLVTTAGGYVLRVGPEELDVQRCERLIGEGRSLLAAGRPDQALAALSGALELWRGDVLADFQYDAFAQGEIARLGELRAAVLEERIAVEMLLGREAQVLGELERLVRDYPYRERLRGQLMLALYRTGRQAEALEVYRQTRRLLVEELGIEPGIELRRLEQAILALRDPSWLGRPTDGPPDRRHLRRIAADLELPILDGSSAGPVRKAAFIDLGPARQVGDLVLVEIAWRSASFAPLFPVFAGQLSISVSDIVLEGRYAPPSGKLGLLLDQALLHLVAGRTASALVARLAKEFGA